MSEFDEEIDGNSVICPYCKYEYHPETEDFDEDETVEKCRNRKCGKSFYHHDEVCYDHHTRPDCELNNQKHKWETITFRDGSKGKHDFCEVCGIIKPLRKQTNE